MDFRTRFPLRLWRPAIDEEVDAELAFHLEMRTRELVAAGMTEAQARQAAMDRFGDYTGARRACRAIGHQREQRMRVLQYLSELRQDAAFAVRQMLVTPVFTVVALATLGIGVGATTAIFSAVRAVVLRPLPVPQPDRIVVVNSTWREGLMAVAPRHYLHLASEQAVFQGIAAAEFRSFTVAREEGAERVLGARVTGGFFDVFRVQPFLGRVFGAAEDEPGRDQVVVLSHRLWARQFGGDPALIGRDITLNQRPHLVVGVMPASFDFSADGEDLWVPMAFTPEQRNIRDQHFLTVFGRLRDEVTIEQASRQLALVVQHRVQLWPDEDPGRGLRVTPLMEQLIGEYRQRLFILLAAVALVLLIACGNVSNLLLARGATRARELAVRSALGAGQGRLVRQLFTESIVLGLVATAAGIGLAHVLIRLLIAFGPPDVPRLEQTRIDGVVLAFAVVLALAASVVFGIVPAWRASRSDMHSTLKEAGRGAGARGARDIVRSTLIGAEIALAIVLLVGAGLLIRTALEMQRIEPGFDPQGVLTGRVLLAPMKYRDAPVLLAATRELEAAVARIPGVSGAAVSSAVPGVRSFSNGLLPEGLALDLKNITQSDGVMISPSYFSVMRLPITEGRPFTDGDRAGSPLVVILNRTAAERMWPGQKAIGKRLTSANPLGRTTVVGIAGDVRLGGPSEEAPPTFYVPYAQMNDEAWEWSRAVAVVARTQTDPQSLGGSLRKAIAAVDPSIPLYDVRTMEQRMADTIATARFNTVLLSILGAVGLLLAAVGIYGVISYFASQRTSEIGIRMALGASRLDVMRMVVRQATRPVAGGVAAGTAGALFASRAIATQLVNVKPTDPVTFAAAAVALIVVAFAAALIPARRASMLDPTKALQG